MSLKLKKIGKSTSEIEVTNISIHGIWIFIHNTEYFLTFDEYPWFKNKKIEDIFNVKLYHETHLHWPSLDIDIELDSLINPEKYNLKYAN